MMSLEVIVAVNQQIARQAAKEGLVPYIPVNADEVDTARSSANVDELPCAVVDGAHASVVAAGTARSAPRPTRRSPA